MLTVRNQNRHRRGFTLIEAIVVIVILGVLATMIAPRLISRIGDSRHAVAKSKAAALVTQVELFLADHGAKMLGESISIDVLYERPSYVSSGEYEPYVRNEGDLLDPWGNKFGLIYPGNKNKHDFDIVSYGADGKPGGEGENEDVIKP